MIDLHTHTFFSDGVLIPSELVYRAKFLNYAAIAITDHIDYSNMDFVIPKIVEVSKVLTDNYEIFVLPGAELTYIPPKLIGAATEKCRKLGAKIIVVHGETKAETVPPQTNLSAVKADIDILAHPGFLSEEEAEIAAKNDIKIEITTRNFHKKTNDAVARVALQKSAKLVLNTDAHQPDNLLTKQIIKETLAAAGLEENYYEIMLKNSREIISKYQKGAKER
ncbi:MAG: histidinol phosphate phosphatase domain-containing protein [Elusimicrobiota bacterium]|jgi:histidinol phosphatase-like PHP family hydrolase|nr:histidinol phosphate phosphatase domain-containing protein [Elusimicrobiota bacterium]